MIRTTLTATIAALALAGCAESIEDFSAANHALEYNLMTCAQAEARLVTETARLADIEARVVTSPFQEGRRAGEAAGFRGRILGLQDRLYRCQGVTS